MAFRIARSLSHAAWVAVALGLAACGGDNTETEPEVAATQVAPDQGAANPADPRGPSDMGEQARDGITRYSCDGGWTVELTGDTARVSALDGRVIDLPVTDRSPPLYAGEALEFSLDEGGATLGQDEGGPFACERD